MKNNKDAALHGKAPGGTKSSRNSRPVLVDVAPADSNRRSLRLSNNTDTNIPQWKKETATTTKLAAVAPRRRSGRLSLASKQVPKIAPTEVVRQQHSVAGRNGRIADRRAKQKPTFKRTATSLDEGTTAAAAWNGDGKSVSHRRGKSDRRVRSEPPPSSSPAKRVRRLFSSTTTNNNSSANCSAGSDNPQQQMCEMEGLPQEHHNLVLTNFQPTKYTSGLSFFDTHHRGDVLQSPEYVSDIFQRLYQSESRNFLNCYIHKQKDLSANMRAVLVDWLVEIHLKFRCVPETLHLAVNIIDRYLANVDIERELLQLVGVTAFLLAAKYEEIYPPELRDIIVITDRAYSRQDVLDTEAEMLAELSFNLTVPTGHPFLQRFLFITRATKTMATAANYFLERMLQEHDALQFRPSVLAAASVCLAINHPEIRDHDGLENDKPGVPQELVDYSGYCRTTIFHTAEFVADKVAESITTQKDRHLIAVKRKYAGRHFDSISTDFAPPDAVDILDD